MPLNDYQIVISAQRTRAGDHKRRFNAPTIEEVAIYYYYYLNLKRVAETHRSYDALQYLLFFRVGKTDTIFNGSNPTSSLKNQQLKKCLRKIFMHTCL